MLLQEYFPRSQTALEIVRDFAAKNLQVAQDVQKQCYDSCIRPRPFEVGASVCLLVPEHINKLQPKWQKCCKYCQMIIQDHPKSRKLFVLHTNGLKYFLAKEEGLLCVVLKR